MVRNSIMEKERDSVNRKKGVKTDALTMQE